LSCTASRRLKPPGSKITLGYLRNGVAKAVDLTLATLPATQATSVENGDGIAMPKVGMKLAPAAQAGSQTSGVMVSDVDPNELSPDQLRFGGENGPGLTSEVPLARTMGLPL
jgi:hypothetical protein